jgi:hypothetical protein
MQLIDRANSWARLLGVTEQVHYMMANATVSLESMLSSYPGPLTLVTVQVGSANIVNGQITPAGWDVAALKCNVLEHMPVMCAVSRPAL